MAAAGPFEPNPRVAVAVSGGADSLCLMLLADEWARAHGGAGVGLTVDHRFREESTEEASTVGRWLAARGIPHAILVRRGEKPAGDLQAAAREARYALLGAWCRSEGVLHLLLAHHRDDQAETFLMRLGRGSGVDGLAAMPMVREARDHRVVRPLLGVPAGRLRATLERHDQPWIEDPSNADTAYTRTAVRSMLPDLAGIGLTPARISATTDHLARARIALERARAELLGRAVCLYPEGYALVDRTAIVDAPDEVGLRALAALLTTLSGAAYQPRYERLRSLFEALRAGDLAGARTLHGCTLRTWRESLLLSREPAAMAASVPLYGGETVEWDGRFAIAASGVARPLHIASLGDDGWRAVSTASGGTGHDAIPAPVGPTLPAVWDLDGLLAVPHLSFQRSSAAGRQEGRFCVRFDPAQPAAGIPFAAPPGETR